MLAVVGRGKEKGKGKWMLLMKLGVIASTTFGASVGEASVWGRKPRAQSGSCYVRPWTWGPERLNHFALPGSSTWLLPRPVAPGPPMAQFCPRDPHQAVSISGQVLPAHLCTPSHYLEAWNLDGCSRNACWRNEQEEGLWLDIPNLHHV